MGLKTQLPGEDRLALFGFVAVQDGWILTRGEVRRDFDWG
jgi:hypothetical protein